MKRRLLPSLGLVVLALTVSSGCSIPGDDGWYVDSVKDGIVTVRHLNLVYKAASTSLPQYHYQELIAANELVGKRVPDRGSKALGTLDRGAENGVFVEDGLMWVWSRKGTTAALLDVTSTEVKQ
jgi:hypothetical protein